MESHPNPLLSRSTIDMSAHSFDLNFNGYWREPNIAGIPAEPGIFCAYLCTFNSTEKTVAIAELIFVGESENAGKTVAEHQLWPTWRAMKRQDQQVCFNFAPVSAEHRQWCAAALIYKFQPATNQEFKERFSFDDVTLSLIGRFFPHVGQVTVKRNT